jgi:hypothetical protein
MSEVVNLSDHRPPVELGHMVHGTFSSMDRDRRFMPRSPRLEYMADGMPLGHVMTAPSEQLPMDPDRASRPLGAMVADKLFVLNGEFS